jgi:hypothetical protein
MKQPIQSIQWLDTPGTFDFEWARLDDRIWLERRLPQNWMKRPAVKTGFVDGALILRKTFWDTCLALVSALDEHEFFVGALEPAPREYFFEHFGKFPWLRLTPSASSREVLESLQQDPGESPADALGSRPEVLVIYGAELRWLILVDRIVDLAMVSFWDEEAARHWDELAPPHLQVVNAEDALRLADQAAVDGSFTKELRKNYPSV